MLSLFVGLCGLLWLLGIPMPFPFFLLLVAEACCTVAYWRTVFQLRSERDVKLAHSSLLVEVRGGAGRPCSSLTSTSFKKINDSFGHEAGDDALVRFAGLLADLASGGVICRLGGAEFQIALPGQSMAAAVGYGECLQAALRENLAAGGQRLSAVHHQRRGRCYPGDGDTIAELSRRADEAMYAAKAAGGDRTRAWQALGEAKAA